MNTDPIENINDKIKTQDEALKDSVFNQLFDSHLRLVDLVEALTKQVVTLTTKVEILEAIGGK